VLSQLNKHELALNHAMSAVILLQEDLLFKAVNGEKKEEEEEETIQLKTKKKDPNKDRKSVLAIAYHNMGVEQEFLRSYHAAILSYKKAVNFAEKNLGPDDGITENLRNVYENARSELDPSFKKKKRERRKSMNLRECIKKCLEQMMMFLTPFQAEKWKEKAKMRKILKINNALFQF